MTRFNFRKLVLAIADVFIIIVSGIVSNYILTLFGYPYIPASRELLYAIVIDLVLTLFAMFVFGSYTKLWRYFNIKDYIVCMFAMIVGFIGGYVVTLILQMPQNLQYYDWCG